ncbi:unnamed protein product, partial [Schistosoma haematobium]
MTKLSRSFGKMFCLTKIGISFPIKLPLRRYLKDEPPVKVTSLCIYKSIRPCEKNLYFHKDRLNMCSKIF